MRDYEELVKSLRICADSADPIIECCFSNCCEHDEPIDPLCMGQLIHMAADAIEELQKRVDVEKAFSDAWEENANECHVRFQKLLDAFPKWIKANGNPSNNNGQQFLVYIVYPSGSGEVTLGEYWDKCEDQKDFGWGTRGSGVVTHYMPLPNPPKEE